MKSIFLGVFVFFLMTMNAQSYKKSKKIKPAFVATLSDSITETSGLIAFDGLLWTHNDDHDTTLYGLDTLGKIKKKVSFSGLKNIDWEEITQDEHYIYIGDFGNNYQGNRTDLRIYKIAKSEFYEADPKIDTITFSYADQTEFAAQKSNSTNFDCEAFVAANDSLYLFTKRWNDQKSAVYVLSKQAGKQQAKLKTILNVKGLVTGATLTPNQQTVVLCGYTKKGKAFLYLMSDFLKMDFSSLSTKRMSLKLRFHQIEGICTFDGNTFYISNEKFVLKPFISNSQKLHKIGLGLWIN